MPLIMTANVIQDETPEDLLKQYLLWDVENKQKEISKEKAKKEIEKIEAETEIKVAKALKKQYEKMWFNSYVNTLAEALKTQWTDINNIEKDVETYDILGKEKKEYDIEQVKEKYATVKTEIFNLIEKDYPDYKVQLLKIDPNFETPLETLQKTVEQKAQNKFAELKEKALKLAEEIKQKQLALLAKYKKLQDVKFDNEKALQKIAEIPITIEDKIQEIKDMLDKLLGKYLDKFMNPESPEFDLDILIAKLKAVTEPLLAVITPLQDVGGQVPIIGELTSILSMVKSSSGNTEISKEEIKKLLPQKPEIPSKVWNAIKGIGQDIWEATQQLPLMLINIIFQMIGVIIGMFEQIAGVIGVPGIPYPLSLLPTCIESVPVILKFMYNGGSQMINLLQGVVKDKLAEAAALAIPKPDLDMEMLKSLLPDIEKIEKDEAASKSKPETKNIDYVDVVKETHEVLNNIDNTFSRTDVQRVLKSYQEIYNGTNTTINMYDPSKTGKEVVSENTIMGFIDDKEDEIVPNKSTIVRKKGTPEDFKVKMDEVIASLDKEDNNSIRYEKIKKTSSVVGGALYEKYSDAIKEKEPNPDVVIREKVKPRMFLK